MDDTDPSSVSQTPHGEDDPAVTAGPQTILYYEREALNMGLRLRKIVGAVARIFSPSYSWCKRCRRPWSICDGHATTYNEGSGCFPLCEPCWKELTPQTRLPYYRALWQIWTRRDPKQWEMIKVAVLNGK